MSTDVTTWTPCCDWFSSCSVFSVMKSEHVGVERVLMEVYFCQEQKFIVESRSGLKVMKSELWERKSEESNLHPDVAQMSSVGDLKPVFCLTQQSCLFLSGGITIKTKSTRPHKTRLSGPQPDKISKCFFSSVDLKPVWEQTLWFPPDIDSVGIKL